MGVRERVSGLLVALCLMLPTTATSATFDPYGQLLERYLIEATLPDNGLLSAFEYERALADDRTRTLIAEQRRSLSAFDPSTLDSREAAVAFWINAYNFFMLDQILTEQPDGELVASVWDYGGRVNPFVDSVFDREKFTVGGREYSLNQIEKGILLGKEYQAKGWKDARVHFAVNCASVGCPPLRKQVYTAGNLEQLLAENTRRAFNTPRHLIVEGDTVRATELFKWYREDFEEAAGSALAFIRKWSRSGVADRIDKASDLEFIDYDWSLNRPENFPDTEF